jgi:uncharacterized membrane protein
VFLGHYAVAFAAKRVEPRASLGTYLLSAQFLDLLWPALLLADVEHVRVDPGATAMTPLDFYDYPWSHSLVMSLAWAAAVAGVHFALKRELRVAAILAACVVSHWLLDFATHRPDMPIGIGGPYVGLGLWYSKLGTGLVEFGMLSLGVALYAGSTRARDIVGRWAFVGLVAIIVAIYSTQFFAPPPPGATEIAWLDLGQWLFVALAYWFDAHRAFAPPLARTSVHRTAARERAST